MLNTLDSACQLKELLPFRILEMAWWLPLERVSGYNVQLNWFGLETRLKYFDTEPPLMVFIFTVDCGSTPVTTFLVQAVLKTLFSFLETGCRADFTSDGKKCVFPLRYKGVTYNACTKKDGRGRNWCATAVNNKNEYTEWGYCEIDECNGKDGKVSMKSLECFRMKIS